MIETERRDIETPQTIVRETIERERERERERDGRLAGWAWAVGG